VVGSYNVNKILFSVYQKLSCALKTNMMKYLLTFVILYAMVFLDPVVSAEKVQPMTTAGDSSYIYIYRGGQFAGAFTNFAIWVDNNKLCKLSNGRFFKIAVEPGTHTVSAKRGGVGIGKKETEVEIDVEKGKSYYVSCAMKQSITRVRLEMQEVMPKTGMRDIDKMKIDNCQASAEE
jgi:hypothetical protein